MKQIGLAMMMYTSDWDQTFGFAITNGGPGVPGRTLLDDLYPYMRNWQMWTCPSQRRFPPDPDFPGVGGGIVDWSKAGWGDLYNVTHIPAHHVFNGRIWGGMHIPDFVHNPPRRITEIRYPSTTLLIQECTAYDGWGHVGGGAHIWVDPPAGIHGGNWMIYYYGLIHAGNTGGNIIWADGHASFKPVSEAVDAWYYPDQ